MYEPAAVEDSSCSHTARSRSSSPRSEVHMVGTAQSGRLLRIAGVRTRQGSEDGTQCTGMLCQSSSTGLDSGT